jgi:hypothetical protein
VKQATATECRRTNTTLPDQSFECSLAHTQVGGSFRHREPRRLVPCISEAVKPRVHPLVHEALEGLDHLLGELPFWSPALGPIREGGAPPDRCGVRRAEDAGVVRAAVTPTPSVLSLGGAVRVIATL